MEAHPISVAVLHPSSAKYVEHAGDLPLHQCGSARLNFHLVSRTSCAVSFGAVLQLQLANAGMIRG